MREKTEILKAETSGELFVRLATLGADLLIKTLILIKEGKAERTAQNNA